MTAQEELARRIERDSICRAVQKKIDEGKADFADTARYTDRAAELLGEVLGAYVPDMPTDERETLCKVLLRQRYLDTNAMLNAVQRTLDDAQGLHLAPQIADYPEERVDQAAHSLADETVPMETIVRRAKSAPATIARSFHDDYIEKNAAFRDSAGLKCYITRNAAAKCCEWCTKMAGRYRYGEEPQDVYRRHDNCSCTVTYESGRQRQDVWSKRTWEAPGKNAGAEKPVRLTTEQAKTISQEKSLRVFGNGVDFPAENGIIIYGEHSYFPESISGVKRDAPMTFEQANQKNVNPLFRKGGGYKSNCQSCVAIFEARLRGYNIEAKPMERHTAAYVLSGQTNLVWIDPVTGNNPSYLFNKAANTPGLFIGYLEETVKTDQRFTLEFRLKNGSSHIVFVDRDQSGALRLYDPQKGKVRTGHRIEKYLGKIDYLVPQHSNTTTIIMPDENYIPKLLRVDCCDFDLHIINSISIAKG